MSNDLGDLYQEVIMDHSRHPQNFHQLNDATRTAEGVNPLCGDQLMLYVKLVGDRIEDIAFEGAGCAISMASASLMTAALKGKREDEALTLFEFVHAMLTERPSDEPPLPELGKLEVLSGVSAFPMRVKCATLAWHTLRSVLEGNHELVSSE
jgi:nitrogen fixation protein NifU and related proteins